MLELALGEQGGPVHLREIARRQMISSRYLEQLAHNLKSAGLVKSQRGKRGGFMLNRPPDKITLLDVFLASEGSPMIVDCTENSSLCSRSGHCATREIWCEIGSLIAEQLSRRTLADLVERHKAHVKPVDIIYHI